MKTYFRLILILFCLLFVPAAWADRAANGVECTIHIKSVLHVDAEHDFPDFTLVFTNKSDKNVRLFNDFYPTEEDGPNIGITILNKQGERVGWYQPRYKIERGRSLMHYLILEPGQQFEVPIQQVAELLTFSRRLENNNRYTLEVKYSDDYGQKGTRVDYTGKKEFHTVKNPFQPKRIDNKVTCTIDMKGAVVETGKPFPDFTLVFTNNSDNSVRLFDGFYPVKGEGPDMFIDIRDAQGETTGAYFGRDDGTEHTVRLMRYITLAPGKTYEVPVSNATGMIKLWNPLKQGGNYTLNVTYRDYYSNPGPALRYEGKKEFTVK